MTNEQDLIKNLRTYYSRSLEVLNEFGGPSIYFHTQCIREQKANFLSDRHIELIYATLTSWGMHRMGDPRTTKTKLHEFKEFRSSIIISQKILQQMVELDFANIGENEYETQLKALKETYSKLKVSISDATVVGHAKTLAHILPNLIPPIDRQYTIRFFTQHRTKFFYKSGKYRLVQIPSGLDAQFDLFVQICTKLKRLYSQTDKRIFEINFDTFNTSHPKIMDNLIMAYVKSAPRPKQ